MLTEADSDKLAQLIKSNPDFDMMIQRLTEDTKHTTSIFVHELRNPLSLMKGTIQYIETKHPETKDFKYWNQLPVLIQDLEHMMTDASVLNTCNILKKESHDLSAFIREIKNNFMPQAMTQQIDLILTIKPECEAYFSTYCYDSIRMKQVFSNLIKNAFEATTPGNFIQITLDYKPETALTPPKLSIQISNNGLPIPEDEISNIFIPFITYKKGGTGIGLALVQKIVELHYGSIHVTSSEDLTSFFILLPL